MIVNSRKREKRQAMMPRRFSIRDIFLNPGCLKTAISYNNVHKGYDSETGCSSAARYINRLFLNTD